MTPVTNTTLSYKRPASVLPTMRIKATKVPKRKMSSPSERRLWMPAEDQQLKDAVQQSYDQHGRLDWTFIAEMVPGRDRKACRKRWHQPTCANVNMGRWTAEEDERLMIGVQRHGSHSWTRIADVVETRNGDQCLKRWTNYLNPSIQHSAWSEQEDRLLIMAVQQCGRDWARIASLHFPHRSPLSLRHRDQLLRNRALTANSRGSTPDSVAQAERMSMHQASSSRTPSLNDAYMLATQGDLSRSSSVQSSAGPPPLQHSQHHLSSPQPIMYQQTPMAPLDQYTYSVPGPSNMAPYPMNHQMQVMPTLPTDAQGQPIPWDMYGQAGWWNWLEHQEESPQSPRGGHGSHE